MSEIQVPVEKIEPMTVVLGEPTIEPIAVVISEPIQLTEEQNLLLEWKNKLNESQIEFAMLMVQDLPQIVLFDKPQEFYEEQIQLFKNSQSEQEKIQILQLLCSRQIENKICDLMNLSKILQKYCTDLFGDDDYIKSFDFLKNISEIAESKNYGIKYPKYRQDNYKSLQIWEVKDLQIISQYCCLKDREQIIFTRKKIKEQILGLNNLILKISNSQINSQKLSKELEEIGLAYQKYEKEKKSMQEPRKIPQKSAPKRANPASKIIDEVQKNEKSADELDVKLEKKLLINTPIKKSVQKTKVKTINSDQLSEKSDQKATKKQTTHKKKPVVIIESKEEDKIDLETKELEAKEKIEEEKCNNIKKSTKKPEQQQKPINKITNFFQKIDKNKNSLIKDQSPQLKPQTQNMEEEANQQDQQINNIQQQQKQLFKSYGHQSYLCKRSLDSIQQLDIYLQQQIDLEAGTLINVKKDCQIHNNQSQTFSKRKIYISIKDSKIAYKNVIFNNKSSFINGKNFLKQDPTLDYDQSSADEFDDINGINLSKSLNEQESQDEQSHATDFCEVPDGDFLSEEGLESNDDSVICPQMNNSNLLKIIEKKQKLEPYLLQSSHGSECLQHFQQNFSIQTIGLSKFPLTTLKIEQPKPDIFDENNHELLKALIFRIHGSYETKKDIINNILNEFKDSNLSKNKVEAKIDLISTRERDELGQKFIISETLIHASDIKKEDIDKIFSVKFEAKKAEFEEKKKEQKLKKAQLSEFRKQQRHLQKLKTMVIKTDGQQKTINQYLVPGGDNQQQNFNLEGENSSMLVVDYTSSSCNIDSKNNENNKMIEE